MVVNRLTDLITRDRLASRLKSTSDKNVCISAAVYACLIVWPVEA